MQTDRTLVDAIWDLAEADRKRGFWFIQEGRHSAEPIERHLPFEELVRLAVDRGAGLCAQGLVRGDRVVLVIPDLEEFVVTFVGATLAGLVPVPIYPPIGMGNLDHWIDNVASVVTRTDAALIVTVRKVETVLGKVRRRCTSLRAVVTPESLRTDGGALDLRRPEPHEVAFLQFTSGSTSRPKGVCVTHGNLSANLHAIQRCFELVPEDITVSWLPLYHDMGLIGFTLTPLWVGMSGRLMPSQDFLRRPLSWLEVMSRHRATISVVPNFAYALCARRLALQPRSDLDLSRWRLAGCGAEPVRPSDLEAFAEAAAPMGFRSQSFTPMYGLAESTLCITAPPVGRGPTTTEVDAERLREVGRVETPRPGVEALRLIGCGSVIPEHRLAIFDPEDEGSATPLADHTVGEIRIAGASVTHSYWNDDEATRRARAGQYLRTGDLGFLSAGELYVCGRLKELIIVNGRNYFPSDIERAAANAAGVRRGSIMAFQSDDWGPSPEVVLAVELSHPDAFAEAELRRLVLRATGLVLDQVVTLAPGQLPKTSSGKAQRLEARRLYQAGELRGRRSSRERRPMEVARHFVGSQLAYAAHYVSNAIDSMKDANR